MKIYWKAAILVKTAGSNMRECQHGGYWSYLVVEVIKVTRDKNMNVPHDLQDVQPLMRTDGGHG